jgi:hypothetical protein
VRNKNVGMDSVHAAAAQAENASTGVSCPHMNRRREQGQEGREAPSRPAYLYRYFTTRWAESLLAQGKMFFPSPADFNDPFDCRALVSFEASPVKRERYARELIRERFPHMPKRDQRRLIKKRREKSRMSTRTKAF